MFGIPNSKFYTFLNFIFDSYYACIIEWLFHETAFFGPCPMSMTTPPAKYVLLELDTKPVSSFFLERS